MEKEVTIPVETIYEVDESPEVLRKRAIQSGENIYSHTSRLTLPISGRTVLATFVYTPEGILSPVEVWEEETKEEVDLDEFWEELEEYSARC